MILRNSKKQPLQIDKYRVLSQLGKGGFGTVYYVVDKDKKNKEYALKIYHHSLNIKRIQQQLQVLKVLNTSSLFLQTYRSKKVLNKFFLLFEYAPDNLYKQVKEKIFTQTKALKILLELLDSLDFLHTQGIMHGDIKAENILQKEKQYYIVDYDVSKSTTMFKTVHIESDNHFTAPEIYKGTQSRASDIYSLGCLLYFMLAGEHIYSFSKETNFATKMFGHLYMNANKDENISEKMSYLIARMIDKNEKTRASAEEIREIIKSDNISKKIKSEHKKYNFQNEFEAYKYMAEDGIAYAQNVFGLLHEEGFGIEKDMKIALKWYKKSASQGLVKAEFNLGLCYKMGKGVKKDYVKAFKHFFKASQEGHNRASFHLADMYDNGLGVKKDKRKSIKYLELSASYGYKPAYEKLQNL